MNLHTAEAANSELPLYGTKPKKPGLYLGLFHGRKSAGQEMNGWGFDGPTIGPLRWFHTTYAYDVKIEFVDPTDAIDYFGFAEAQFQLAMDGDMLIYGGMFYGDWTAYYVGPEDCERPRDVFRDTRRSNLLLAHRKYFL